MAYVHYGPIQGKLPEQLLAMSEVTIDESQLLSRINVCVFDKLTAALLVAWLRTNAIA